MIRVFAIGTLTTAFIAVWFLGIFVAFAAAAVCTTAFSSIAAFCAALALTGGVAAVILELARRL